ncbi:peptidase M4 family protein [Candidatus Gracilibacteria bacterium]|nr:peptidase M4 family protein [Candidatus Gracilibacteria bacterium]
MKFSLLIKGRFVPLVAIALVYVLAMGMLAWPFSPTHSSLREPIGRGLQASSALEQDMLRQPSPQGAFTALTARAGEALHISWNTHTGIPDFLSGITADARLPYTPTAAEIGKPLAIARGFLDENRALYGLRSVDEDLRLLRQEPDLQLAFSHFRFSQIYSGLPVFGREIVVHLDADDRVVAVNGQFQPQLALETTPTLSRARAEELALRDLLANQLEPFEQTTVAHQLQPAATELIVYIHHDGAAYLAWKVSIITEAPLGRWTFFVHARREAVIHSIDSVMPVMRRITYSADNTTRIPGRKLIDEGERSRDPVAQAAHDGAGIVYNFYFENFQRNAIDGQGSPLVSTVHYGSSPEDSENAAWIGDLQQMIYGDGGQIFRPLPYGLDVVGHEFTHGVIDSSSRLIYELQPGALNESYADVFGALIDEGNWEIGETVIKSPPYPRPYLRSLRDPNAGGAYDPFNPLGGIGQPASMSEFANLPASRRADNGGVHINSGIPNRAAYLVAQVIGNDRTAQIYYRALTQYLTPTSSFLDSLNASVRAAQDLYGDGEAGSVREAFGQVGIVTDSVPDTPALPDQSTLPDSGQGGQVPAPALPAGCSDIVLNGGFENNDAWVQVVRGDTALIDTQLPYTGRRSAWLGGTDQEAVQLLYQDVSIPANATRVTVDYWRLIHYETSGVLGIFASEARFSTAIANTNGDVLAELESFESSQGDDNWRQAQVDISRFAGKTVRLAFVSENPPGNVSSYFVDDVRMIACTTGDSPSAPPTANNDLVFVQGAITDVNTRRGIPGAQIFIMQPGVSASQAAADDNLTANEVLTVGTADRQGLFQTERPVPRGQSYGVIVFARGYRPIVADGEMNVPANASNPYRVDAQLRRGGDCKLYRTRTHYALAIEGAEQNDTYQSRCSLLYLRRPVGAAVPTDRRTTILGAPLRCGQSLARQLLAREPVPDRRYGAVQRVARAARPAVTAG